MHPEQNTTNKLISYHLSHNNYWNIELRNTSYKIDSLTLTQASVNQLPGSSNVNNRVVSVSSSVSDNCRKFQTFTRLEKFIHKSQNEENEDMFSKANAEIELFWAVHSEALVFSHTERLLVWTILKQFLSFLYALRFHHKSQKNSPIELWHHDSKIPFWGCDNHFSSKERCVFHGICKIHWLCSFALGLRRWMNW